jgi:hypothetical protein
MSWETEIAAQNQLSLGLKQPVKEARMDSLITHFWAGLSELSLIATR